MPEILQLLNVRPDQPIRPAAPPTLQAGGCFKDGVFNGHLPVSRSLGDAAAKAGSLGILPTPDVSSFVVGAPQRFVLLGHAGAWKHRRRVAAATRGLRHTAYTSNNAAR